MISNEMSHLFNSPCKLVTASFKWSISYWIIGSVCCRNIENYSAVPKYTKPSIYNLFVLAIQHLRSKMTPMKMKAWVRLMLRASEKLKAGGEPRRIRETKIMQVYGLLVV